VDAYEELHIFTQCWMVVLPLPLWSLIVPTLVRQAHTHASVFGTTFRIAYARGNHLT
jgi:hypothetical protein